MMYMILFYETAVLSVHTVTLTINGCLHFFLLSGWGRCVTKITPAKMLKCQREQVDDVLSKDPLFMPLKDDVLNYEKSNFFKFNEEPEKQKTKYYIKYMELEAALPVFRDYATLVLEQLNPLVQHYCGLSRLQIRGL